MKNFIVQCYCCPHLFLLVAVVQYYRYLLVLWLFVEVLWYLPAGCSSSVGWGSSSVVYIATQYIITSIRHDILRIFLLDGRGFWS